MSNHRIKLRRGTAANWNRSSIPLVEGEVGIDLNSYDDGVHLKIGLSGEKPWNNLPELVIPVKGLIPVKEIQISGSRTVNLSPNTYYKILPPTTPLSDEETITFNLVGSQSQYKQWIWSFTPDNSSIAYRFPENILWDTIPNIETDIEEGNSVVYLVTVLENLGTFKKYTTAGSSADDEG